MSYLSEVAFLVFRSGYNSDQMDYAKIEEALFVKGKSIWTAAREEIERQASKKKEFKHLVRGLRREDTKGQDGRSTNEEAEELSKGNQEVIENSYGIEGKGA